MNYTKSIFLISLLFFSTIFTKALRFPDFDLIIPSFYWENPYQIALSLNIILSRLEARGNLEAEVSDELLDKLQQMGIDLKMTDEKNFNALFFAIEWDFNIIDFLLKAGLDVNSRTIRKRTPLSWALSNYNDQVIPKLIKSGANVNTQDDHGKTPLYYAAMFNNLFAAEALLAAGADKNIASRFGKTPEQYARSLQYNEIADLIRDWQQSVQ